MTIDKLKSKEARSPMSYIMDGVHWEQVAVAQCCDDDLPWVTHQGVFDFAGARLRCYQLSDGQRVFDADDVESAFGVHE
jgi:hypothetical protein